MELELSSGLFTVNGPDGYWLLGSFIESLEERENERHAANRWAIDREPGLFDEDEPFYIPSPGWLPGRYDIDYAKFLAEVSKIWLEAFTGRMKEAGIKAKAKFDRVCHPKEYNHGGDKAYFTLSVTKTEIARLAGQCLANGNFEGHLRGTYASYDGFWCFSTDSVYRFEENMQGKHGADDYERSAAQAINFAMFPKRSVAEEWNGDFMRRIYDADEAGEFDDCFSFTPGGEAENE